MQASTTNSVDQIPPRTKKEQRTINKKKKATAREIEALNQMLASQERVAYIFSEKEIELVYLAIDNIFRANQHLTFFQVDINVNVQDSFIHIERLGAGGNYEKWIRIVAYNSDLLDCDLDVYNPNKNRSGGRWKGFGTYETLEKCLQHAESLSLVT